MEALQQQWENTQAQVEQCGQDSKKLKKNTTRLQNGMEVWAVALGTIQV